ncbi:DUF1016 domain-containing protein [Thiorhodococcus mannitoliphagus]|uniref:DUF1016 domain-containing protein n=1 Tax=Thiorhodococcus mannitoliphagus TaxID=329406 RepID=A0A6P1DLC2_9GAMM|nr:PDDEXK nuclease domain-containing protein [Thiorhodococcus mannitoliphagus]NEX18818.1 DUF1016 domain-containing protein [Thiorhodococcus mannitoliphagus]
MVDAKAPEIKQLVALFEQTHHELQRRAARSVDTALVVRNWLFGYYLVEYVNAGAPRAKLYGKALIDRLAASLKARGMKGVSPTSLRRFRAFYEAYSEIQPKVLVESNSAPSGSTEIQPKALVESRLAGLQALESAVRELSEHFQLGWSHYIALQTVRDAQARRFDEIEACANSWGVRELERQIASALYERLALSRDKAEIKKLAEQGLVVEEAADIIKNPYVLEFLDLDEQSSYNEHELETAIIDKLEHFLLELGKGFLFEARQKRFTFDNDHFYVDLVFYNRLLRCYVIIDLKLDKLTHQDLGQMQMYVNYFDRYVKTAEEAPTIGILLCQQKNDAVVELTLPVDSNIYASEYQLYLPSKEELRQKVITWAKEVEG